jgi:hypothetical protein
MGNQQKEGKSRRSQKNPFPRRDTVVSVPFPTWPLSGIVVFGRSDGDEAPEYQHPDARQRPEFLSRSKNMTIKFVCWAKDRKLCC